MPILRRTKPSPSLAAARWRAPRLAGVAVALGVLLSLSLPTLAARAASTPTFVQTKSNEVSSGTIEHAGVHQRQHVWQPDRRLRDLEQHQHRHRHRQQRQRVRSAAGRTTWGSSWSSQVFYAKGIAGGANTVTATFATAINGFAVVYIHEYSGVDKVGPVDVDHDGHRHQPGDEQWRADHDERLRPAVRRRRVHRHGDGGRDRLSRLARPARAIARRTVTSRLAGSTARRRSRTVATPGSCSSLRSRRTAARQTPRHRPSRSPHRPAAPGQRHRQRDGGRRRQRRRRGRPVPGRRRRHRATGHRRRRTRWRGTRARVANGAHTLDRARLRRRRQHQAVCAASPSTSANTSSFQNEVLATGFDLPTAIKFLPDGRMLVAELQGKIKVLPPPYTTPDPTPFLQLTQRRRRPACSRGSTTSRSTRTSSINHYYYVFYTLGSPNRDRLSRFTANATAHRHGRRQRVRALPGPAGRQRRAPRRRDQLRQRRQDLLHDGRALRRRGRPGPAPARAARSTASTPTARSRPTTRSTTAAGRTSTRSGPSGCATPTAPTTTRRPAGCSSATSAATTTSTADRGGRTSAPRGANYGWPNCEGNCPAPCTSPIYSYPHNGPRLGHHRRVRLPRQRSSRAAYEGSYFFADYTQNWIKRLTLRRERQRHRRLQLRAAGRVASTARTATSSTSPRAPTARSTTSTSATRTSAARSASARSAASATSQANQAPIAHASADADDRAGAADGRTSRAPARSDPEGQPLTYQWTFGDGHDLDGGEPGPHVLAGRARTPCGCRCPTASTAPCRRL